MEFLPVGKRTRGQKAKMLKEQNKKACLAAKKKWMEMKEKSLEVYNNNGGKKVETLEEDDYDHDAMVIDEDEYLKAVNSGGSEKPCENEAMSIVKKEIIDYDDDDNHENHHNPPFNVVNGDESDDASLQILGERWNPLAVEMCCDSDDEDKVGVSGEKVASTDIESSSSEEDDTEIDDETFVVENPEASVSESSSSDDNSVEEVDEKHLNSKYAKFAHVHDDDGNGGSGGFKSFKHNKKGKKRALGVKFQNRVPASLVNDDDDGSSDGIKSFKHDRKGKERVLSDKFRNRAPSSPVKDDDDDDDNGGIKSFKNDRKGKERVSGDKHRDRVPASPMKNGLKKSLIAEKTEKESNLGSISCPITVEVDETASTSSLSSSSLNDDDNDNNNDNENANYNKNGEGLRNQKDGGRRKKGRPSLKKEPKKKKLKNKQAESIFLNTILENGSTAGLEDIVPSIKDQDDLVRKFRFGDDEVVLEKSEYEQELEHLFKELDFGLGVCDIGLEHSSLYEKEEDEEAVLCESVALQEKLCREGKHYLILDEEVGIKCKFCSFVMLEIRDVTPAFNDNPFGKSRNTYSGRFPNDQNNSDKFQFPESNYDFGGDHDDETRGTVWDLIPGVKRKLYEHQQQGFEFIWRNISGGVKIEDLDKPSKYGIGGCIICHAPGTGKTRLAIVFLQSYLKQYPMSKPVIIAPSSMLLTWEEEFARWNVDIPFLNLNSSELSNKEIEVLGFVGDVKGSKAVRKAKLCIWTMGKGILGISYTLFEKLAGERKETEERIKKALLEQPGILFLDEGHTPRNDESNIWKVFSEVHTKKRVILSGTPFQNNFDELNNTLSLIREEFRDPFIRRNYVKRGRKSQKERHDFYSSKLAEQRRIEDLRNQMKPFVHVHKGEILRKTLRGLFHSVLVLKPSEVQKKYFRYLSGIKNGLCLDYLVCIASVHPYLLSKCDQAPDFGDKSLLNKYKTDLEAGVKIKFLLELIKLSKGEKVLVFSQFLYPLEFIGEWLQSYFNWTEGNEYLFMEGKQRPTQRQSLIGLFNDPKSEARVLLASTKACSEGIHLVGASRVVLLDVVWNPSVERQAISRAYRLGQKKDVYVYHLIISDTQEGEKYYRQVAKDRVSEQVFTSSEGDGGQKTSTLSRVSEDRILEEMVQHEKLKYMFEKIIYQPKVDKLIESFAPLNL